MGVWQGLDELSELSKRSEKRFVKYCTKPIPLEAEEPECALDHETVKQMIDLNVLVFEYKCPKCGKKLADGT